MAGQKKNYRTTIIFTLKDRIGILCDALKAFKTNKINLTRIVSRPHMKKEWNFIFFIEINGKKDNLRVQKALKGLKKYSHNVYIFGDYPLTIL